MSLVACEGSPTRPTPLPTAVEEGDFVGSVLTPNYDRYNTRPVAGVAVTIVAGSYAGARTTTDHNGVYSFSALVGKEFHLRVKKPGFETKEALVYRNQPTALPGPVKFYYGPGGAQQTPGVVLIGRPWPAPIRNVLRQMTIATDALLVVGNHFGQYSAGVAEVSSLSDVGTIMHEACHSHQEAWKHTINPTGGGGSWRDTAEAEAFRVARAKDWEERGRAGYDSPYGLNNENGAETCARYWEVDGRPHKSRQYLKENAPRRLEWARAWLTIRPGTTP